MTRYKLPGTLFADYTSKLPESSLDPVSWVAIDAYPDDNCMLTAAANALSIRRLLRKPGVSTLRRAVTQLKSSVSSFMCRRPDVFGPLLFPSAGARLLRARAALVPTTDTTAPTSEASAAAIRAGMRTYCARVRAESCHGGRVMLLALAHTLKKNVCVYKVRRDRFVLKASYGPRSAPKLRLLHAGSMAYMAVVRCSLLSDGTGRSLCSSAHWSPVRVASNNNSNKRANNAANGNGSNGTNRSANNAANANNWGWANDAGNLRSAYAWR